MGAQDENWQALMTLEKLAASFGPDGARRSGLEARLKMPAIYRFDRCGERAFSRSRLSRRATWPEPPLDTASGRPCGLMGAVGELPEAGQCGEWEVHVRAGAAAGRLRLCGARQVPERYRLGWQIELAKHDERGARGWL